jgi:hypothetical protein
MNMQRYKLTMLLVVIISFTNIFAQDNVAVFQSDYDLNNNTNADSQWKYYWNSPDNWVAGSNPGDLSTGAIGDPESYTAMISTGAMFTADGDGDGGNSTPDNYVRLTSTGGHPGATGASVELDRYSICAYTVSTPGNYFILDSWIDIENINSNGLKVYVHINNDDAIVNKTLNYGGDKSFNANLGNLLVGDIIYIAIGANGHSSYDGYTMDFGIATDANYEPSTDYYVKDFGAVGDGINDDGAAIQEALEALFFSTETIKTLHFESNKTYYTNTINGTYLLGLKNKSNITIEGNGSTFLLGPAVRFVENDGSSDITVQDLNINYKPLPYFEGIIIAQNTSEKYVDVRIDDGFELPPLGGPSDNPAEQAYFGYVWEDFTYSFTDTPYGQGLHYYVGDMTAVGDLNTDRVVRVFTPTDKNTYSHWDKITVNETKATFPVRNIAHIGGNAVIDSRDSENILLSNINIWSAPWFATRTNRCSGFFTFDNVNIRPEVGTNRRMSSWRDGIHMKSNYATLLFKDCFLGGMGDDAFNIATFMSNIKVATDPSNIQIKQNYPLNIVPYNPGDVVVVYDVVQGKYLGRSKVASSEGFVQTGVASAPLITLALTTPVAGMSTNCMVWNETSANPNTKLLRCELYRSCRFQSSVTIDDCDLVSLSYYRCENAEGPISTNSIVKNSRMYVDGNSKIHAASLGTYLSINGQVYSPKEFPIENMLFQNNKIQGDFKFNHCKNIAMMNNEFVDAVTDIIINTSFNLLFRDNSFLGNDLTLSDLYINDTPDSVVIVESSDDKTRIEIMQPFSHWEGYIADGTSYPYNVLDDSIKPGLVSDVLIDNQTYECYRIVLPGQSNPIRKISLELFPQEESETISFWSYLDANETGRITAIAVNNLGVETEVYSEELTGGGLQNHTINIPADYFDKRGTFKLYFSTDNQASKILYLGASEIQTSIKAEPDNSNTKLLCTIIAKEQGVELNVSKTGGNLKVYDLMGRTIYSKYIADMKTVINRHQMQYSGPVIFQYMVEGSIYRKKILY